MSSDEITFCCRMSCQTGINYQYSEQIVISPLPFLAYREKLSSGFILIFLTLICVFASSDFVLR